MKVIHSFDVYGMFSRIKIILSMRANAYDASIAHLFGLCRLSFCSGCLLPLLNYVQKLLVVWWNR
jgi:hypothetical protein